MLSAPRDRAPVLRLAASHTIGELLLPGWLAGFRAAGGDVRAQVDVVNSAAVVAAVREGTAEIGFVEGRDRLDAFDTLDLVRDEIVAVVAPGHRWARRARVPAALLPTDPFLTREAGSGTLRALAVSGLGLSRTLRAVRRRRPALPPAARRLWTWLRSGPPA